MTGDPLISAGLGERFACCITSTGPPSTWSGFPPTTRFCVGSLSPGRTSKPWTRFILRGQETAFSASLPGSSAASVPGRRQTHSDRRTQAPNIYVFALKLTFQHWPQALPVVFLEGTKSLDSFFETMFARCPSLDNRGLPAGHSFK